MDGRKCRRRRSSIAELCNRRLRAAHAPVTTAPNAGKAIKSIKAVDTLGLLLALCVTAADEQDHAQVAELAERVQAETGETVEIAFVDQGYTGENAADAAQEHGIKLEVVKRRRQRRASSYCPGDGLSNGASAECPAFDSWRKTTSDCLRLWPDSITWPSFSVSVKLVSYAANF